LNNLIAPDEFVAVMEEAFARGQELTFTPSGQSMRPMLDGVEDKVTFSPKPDRLKKYDVAFYRRTSGQLVLHRVVGYRDDAYVFSGDNQYYYEYGVRHDDILAIMTAFTHKGRAHRVDEFGYRLYIRAMMLKKRLRILAVKIYRFCFHRSQ
jgi:hypothetical protein